MAALTRSEVMSRVKGKNTKPEIRVRSALHAAGLRFRLHDRTLPGCPDIIFPSRRCVVFVHGCFWHRHPSCGATRTPKTEVEFWENKFRDNVSRDARATAELKAQGWNVIVFWECQTKDPAALSSLIDEIRSLPLSRRRNRKAPNQSSR